MILNVYKQIGYNFLNRHPMMEHKLNIDKGHCIVDVEDLELIYDFFNRNECLMSYLEEDKIRWDRNTNKPIKIL